MRSKPPRWRPTEEGAAFSCARAAGCVITGHASGQLAAPKQSTHVIDLLAPLLAGLDAFIYVRTVYARVDEHSQGIHGQISMHRCALSKGYSVSGVLDQHVD